MGDQGCYICRSIIYIDFISFMFIISVEVMIFNSKCLLNNLDIGQDNSLMNNLGMIFNSQCLLINLDIGQGNCMNNLDD